ncbi:uncharacterized protein LOC119332867 [Triticum dicoccoides]|uniref:uncharacterized protein LOC119332867 n=1 Tax=Triticum dicoccoides TaxID=85692 RepID=UPI0018919D50|nr:uncharacterized protein LOC119332867 [Triticum dicoccoides]
MRRPRCPSETRMEIDAHPSSSASAAAASSSSSPTESAVMQIRAKRTCYAAASSEARGWAELPDDLLRPIVALLSSSFRDLLAFGSTCHPWRDFSAHTSSLYHLLLHPSTDRQQYPWYDYDYWTLFHECTWRLADPAAASSYPSLLSLSDLRGMFFLRCSYGHLIFFDNKGFYIVNAFSGAKVVPPCLKSNNFIHISYATLTAPVASADSHLLVGSGGYLFQWRVGSDSWLEHYPKVPFLRIEQIVAFKGKTYTLGSFGSFCIVQFSPCLLVQKFEIMFEEDRTEDHYWTNQKTWLVVCDVLLLIKLEAVKRISSEAFQFKAFKLKSLDAKNKKARWAKVDRLNNWAIFVSADGRCEALSFMNPERWGGRSNHIYFPSYESERPWAAVQLWQKANNHSTSSWLSKTGSQYHRLVPTWVLPSAYPRSGQQ